MPELNLDKILASLDLRISEVTLPDEYGQISKDYLGKDSLLAEERKKLPTLSNEDKKSTNQISFSIKLNQEISMSDNVSVKNGESSGCKISSFPVIRPRFEST